MIARLAATMAASLLVLPQIASACPNVKSESKWRNSPIVVEGSITCSINQGVCNLKIERVRKGRGLLRGEGKTLTVVVPIPDPNELYCGVAWTPIDDTIRRGRFYLRPAQDHKFSAPYWPDNLRN
jgi:hypothetical protein